jgi:hypothetical protein
VWLAEDGDHVVDALNRSLQGEQRRLAQRLESAEKTDRLPPEVFQALQDTLAIDLVPMSDERLLKVSHLLDEYGLADFKATYMAESRFSHVSLTAVRQFARDGEEGTLCLGQRPFDGELAPCQDFCLLILFSAMLALDPILIGRPWSDALRRIGADHNLPTVLPSRVGRSAR